MFAMKIDKALLKVDFFSSYKISFEALQALRVFGCINSIFWFYYWYEVPEVSGFPIFAFLTTWGNVLVGIYFMGSVALTQISNRRETQIDEICLFARFLHLIMQASFGMQVVICVVFWGIFLPNISLIFLKHPDHYVQVLSYAVGTHLIVPLAIWIEVWFNQICFVPTDSFPLVSFFSFSYLGVNYYMTQSYGKPVYPPLDWKSFPSIIFISTAYFLTFLGMYTGNKLWKHKLLKMN